MHRAFKWDKYVFLVLAAALTLGGCKADDDNLGWMRASAKTASQAIIDAHIHTRFSEKHEPNSKIPLTREQLLKETSANNVVGVVSHTSDENDVGYNPTPGLDMRFCVGVSAKPNFKKIIAGLKSKKYGCIKIYLGYEYQYASAKPYREVYKIAEKYGVPVVFHTGDTYSFKGKLKYSDPLTIDEVAVDFQNVKFVIAHAGNPWIESAAEVAYKNPNVYIEGSALLVGDLSKLSQEEVDTYVVRPLKWVFGYINNPSKMMFGTDWPIVAMGPYIEAHKKAIPEEHWDRLFYKNAAEVFGFGKE